MDLKCKLSTGQLRGEGGVAGPLSSKRLLKNTKFFFDPLPKKIEQKLSLKTNKNIGAIIHGKELFATLQYRRFTTIFDN